MPSEPSFRDQFVMALARSGVNEALVPLEVFMEICVGMPINTMIQPQISLAGGAMVIKPLSAGVSHSFESASEIHDFIELAKKKL